MKTAQQVAERPKTPLATSSSADATLAARRAATLKLLLVCIKTEPKTSTKLP